MPFIQAKGTRIHYQLVGDGEPVVAISGLMSTTTSSQFLQIPEITDHYSLVLAEHRGAGKSDCSAAPYRISDLADDWITIMDELGINKATLLGNSMGSLIAQSIAFRYPQRVLKLVLSVPLYRPDAYLQDLLKGWLSLFDQQGAEAYISNTLLWSLLPETYNRHAATLLNSIQPLAAQISREGLHGQISAMLNYDGYANVSDIPVPTLIIGSEQDRICPPHHARALEKWIPNATLKLLRSSGHLPQTEQTAAYGKLVGDFL